MVPSCLRIISCFGVAKPVHPGRSQGMVMCSDIGRFQTAEQTTYACAFPFFLLTFAMAFLSSLEIAEPLSFSAFACNSAPR